MAARASAISRPARAFSISNSLALSSSTIAAVLLLKGPAAHQGLDTGPQDVQVAGFAHEIIGAGFQAPIQVSLIVRWQ